MYYTNRRLITENDSRSTPGRQGGSECAWLRLQHPVEDMKHSEKQERETHTQGEKAVNRN